MALVAQRDKIIKSVGGKQRRLPPYMRHDVWLLRRAHPAYPTIPVEARCLGTRRPRSVIGVEDYVKRHARRCQESDAPAASEEQQGQDDGWVVQESCCRVCGRIRTVERSCRRGGVQALVARHEPQVMVDIDEDARRPRQRDRAAESGIQEGSEPARKRDMVSNPH
jgi:hypothetical protein